MTSRPADSDAMAVEDTTDTEAGTNPAQATTRPDARPRLRLHLGRDRHLDFDYRQTAIAAGVLGLGVLAFRGVTALLDRRVRAEAEPFPRDDRSRTPPAAMAPASSTATLVGTDTGAEFVGEPVNRQADAPFVAASDDDDTAGLTTASTGGADRSALTPEHVPTDLMGDASPGAGERAIDAFRPDATAPVPPEMRESLRPATGPATGFAGNRGDFAQGLSQADGSK